MAQQPKHKKQERKEPKHKKAPPAPGKGGRELTEQELNRAVGGANDIFNKVPDKL
jgi:hypothetical protein